MTPHRKGTDALAHTSPARTKTIPHRIIETEHGMRKCDEAKNQTTGTLSIAYRIST